MTTTTITLGEFEQLRDVLRVLRRTIASCRRSLNKDRKIVRDEYNKMIDTEDKLSDLIDAIEKEIFGTIIVDLGYGATKLNIGIDKANQAISQLQDLNKILKCVDLVFNLAQNIFSVISTGNLAKIADILVEIDKL